MSVNSVETPSIKKRAAIYIRESTKFQDPETQEKECIAYCKSNGFKITKKYRDIASGKKNDRKGFLLMLKDLEDDEFDVLVLWELSRSTRDFITYKTLLETLTQNNKELHSLQEGILTQDDIDIEFSNDIRALINVHERKRVGRRIKYRINFKTREGYWVHGLPPFGYKKENGLLVVDKEEAFIVKEVFELYIAGTPIGDISQRFNLSPRRVSRILTNILYIGKLKVNETEIINDKRVHNKDCEVVEGKHEAIIDKETFLLANSLKRKHKKYSSDMFIISNVYSWNGNKLYPSYNKKQYSYQNKSKDCYISREKLEKMVLDTILNFKFYLNDDTINEVDYRERKNFYVSELDKNKTAETKLLKKYLDGFISEEVFETFMKDIKNKEATIKQNIKEIEQLILNENKQQDNTNLLREYITTLKNTENRNELKQILTILISEVRLINNFRCNVITTIF